MSAQDTKVPIEELLYELLDAHRDTIELAAAGMTPSPEWEIHCAYLRDLQRIGRERLARLDD